MSFTVGQSVKTTGEPVGPGTPGESWPVEGTPGMVEILADAAAPFPFGVRFEGWGGLFFCAAAEIQPAG